MLKPITNNPELDAHLVELLKTANDYWRQSKNEAEVTWQDLDELHHKLWSEAIEEHKRKTAEHAEFRRESLTKSHRARIALLTEQLESVSEEKIIKMRQSQIMTAEADYARRIQELDIALERADIHADPVASGIIHILKEND